VTLIFWVIKVLATTVGETAADFLNVNLGMGLTITSIIMAALLTAALIAQFKLEQHTPAVYWLAVLFTFALGTAAGDLVAEGLNLGFFVALLVFAAAIALVAVAYFVFHLNAGRRDGRVPTHPFVQ
jgi:uncharacterized membrane-anchored protein